MIAVWPLAYSKERGGDLVFCCGPFGQRSEITRKTHMKLVHETINVREISFMKVMKFLVLVKLVS